MVFGPGGDLYVGSADMSGNGASPHTSTVLRFNVTTGACLGTFVLPDSGGLRYPAALIFSETDPVTRAYVGTESQGEWDAVIGTTTASQSRVTGRAAVSGSPAAASLPPSIVGFDTSAAAVALWDAPLQMTPPDAARPAASGAEEPPLVLPRPATSSITHSSGLLRRRGAQRVR
jgi:hypothetical protein